MALSNSVNYTKRLRTQDRISYRVRGATRRRSQDVVSSSANGANGGCPFYAISNGVCWSNDEGSCNVIATSVTSAHCLGATRYSAYRIDRAYSLRSVRITVRCASRYVSASAVRTIRHEGRASVSVNHLHAIVQLHACVFPGKGVSAHALILYQRAGNDRRGDYHRSYFSCLRFWCVSLSLSFFFLNSNKGT